MKLHPFTLDATQKGNYAHFPFMLKGRVWKGLAAGISLVSAGDQSLCIDGKANPNRKTFLSSLGIASNQLVVLSQTHSRLVQLATASDAECRTKAMEILREGDGLVSRDTALYVSVTVADCLPIYLLDSESGAFAVLHSGWKGTGIVKAALDLMKKQWNTRPVAVSAILGPCIRSCCYAVDEERARCFEEEFGLHSKSHGLKGAEFPLGPVVRRSEGQSYIDLQAANARLLASEGISDLSYCENCTFTDTRLGSFRREGSEAFTRMLAFAGNLSQE